MAERAGLELRLPVDAGEAPLGYPEAEDTVAVEIALAGGGYATLVVPADGAKSWAAELFDAVATAQREATGDPHGLSDLEVAFWPDPDEYDAGPGLLVVGDDAGPARVRFHVVLDVDGRCLDTADLRAGMVEVLTARFNATRVAVSAGEPRAGRVG